MIAEHGEATRTDGAEGTGGTPTSVDPTTDIAGDLRRRHGAADRQPPLDNGIRDPLESQRLPHTSPCSRGFACLAQPIEVLERVHHCPCAEAMAALAGVTA